MSAATLKTPATLIVLASDQRRGAEIQGSQLASELSALGHPVDVVALSSSAKAPGLEVDALGADPLGASTLRSLRRRSRSYEVVVGYGSSTLPACSIALTGMTRRFVYRSIGDPRAWVRGGLHRARTALLYRRAASVVALWHGSAESICALYGISPRKVSVIPNARSATHFAPTAPVERAEARHNLGVSDDLPVVAYIGSLAPEKRVDLAMRSMATVDAHLLIAGEGPLRSELEALASDLHIGRVRFLGQVDDVRRVIHASDLLLLTSSTEGMPGVVIEGGLCGVPTVSTRVGAVEELITDGVTGVLIGEADELGVRKAVKRALPSASNLGEAARRTLLHTHSWKAVLPKWIDVLNGTVPR